MSEDEMLEIDGNEVSLMDIAGLDMTDVEEVRFENTPAGIFDFECKDAVLETMDTVKGTRAVVKMTMLIKNVRNLLDDKVDADDLIGKEHGEMFFFTKMPDDLGRLKAFLNDTGYTGSGTLQEILDGFKGHGFTALVKHTVDKNDKDKVYANINRDKGKVTPLAAA